MQIAVAILEKLQKRCPLKYVVVRSASLSPNAMVEEKEISKMKFQVLAERLFKLKWVTADETDDAKLQYEEFEKKLKNLPHLVNLLMILICFLASFFTKTKSISVFGESVATSLFFLTAKVLSKEGLVSINNC